MTDFRDFVIRHLRPWHDFVKKCHINDVNFMECLPQMGKIIVDGEQRFMMPTPCMALPEWTKHVTDDARLKFRERAVCHLMEAWTKFRGVGTKVFPYFRSCFIGDCGHLFDDPGYPLTSIEECMAHLQEIHGADDSEIAKVAHTLETRSSLQLSSPQINVSVVGEILTQRNSRRKRGPVETVDDMKFLKRSRR